MASVTKGYLFSVSSVGTARQKKSAMCGAFSPSLISGSPRLIQQPSRSASIEVLSGCPLFWWWKGLHVCACLLIQEAGSHTEQWGLHSSCIVSEQSLSETQFSTWPKSPVCREKRGAKAAWTCWIVPPTERLFLNYLPLNTSEQSGCRLKEKASIF